jgi:hypothetical protein
MGRSAQQYGAPGVRNALAPTLHSTVASECKRWADAQSRLYDTDVTRAAECGRSLSFGYSIPMKAKSSIVGLLVALIAVPLLVGVAYLASTVVRKSLPVVLSGDIERLAASGPLNDPALATAICGTPVDFLGAPNISSPATALPDASVLPWRPFYPMSGAASVRIVGVGVNRTTTKAITGNCEATITFTYVFAWVDNGRAVVLQSEFGDPPKIAQPK